MDLAGGSAASTSLAIDQLVSLLVLTGKSKSFKGVELLPEVDSLKRELARIKSYIGDIDPRSEGQISTEGWLKEIKHLGERIEDVVNEYILKVSQRPRGFINFLGKTGRLIGTLNRNLTVNIRNIKALLDEIDVRGRRLFRSSGLRSTIFERYHPQYVSPMLEECIVGFDSDRNKLIEWLVEGGSRRSVISIVGAGGMGKTTLAKKVYNNEVVREDFDCCAWVSVSQLNHTNELLKILAKELDVGDVDFDTMESRELIYTLGEFLRGKRYMIVFDGVCKLEFWQVIEFALPDDDDIGSRIIITTRSDIVVASCSETSFHHIHKIEPLSEATSWEIFCKIAFQDYHEFEFRCPPELEEVSCDFIRMCEGLPLAIVVTAGLLSTKEKSESEWCRLRDLFHFQLKFNLGHASKILAICFRDLPSQLKLCFLYFSIFPEDSLIPKDKLIKLWIAEGFVEERKRDLTSEEIAEEYLTEPIRRRDLTSEEIAEEYLTELIRRNMVQACEGFYELEKFCRVHSLMHEIARQNADEFSFCQIRDKNNPALGRKIRRLSIYNNVENILESIEDSQVRSVFLFNIGVLNKSFMVTLFERYKLLTLLDFENAPLVRLPVELGNLFHLKYLNLKNTKVRMLPKSVGKLHNLQTLDLRNTLLIELPKEINKLQNLRHLLASVYDNKVSLDSTQGVRIKAGLWYSVNLQTLMTVDALLSGTALLRKLDELRQLRRLGISRLTAEVASALRACITQMRYLESLSLYSLNNYEVLDLQNISSPPAFLQRLVLKGPLQKLPDWFSSLQNLSLLCLSMSRLSNDPLEYLCHLPNLVSLWLYRAYEGGHLHFEEGGFPKLKLLVLRELHGLKAVEIEEGALPLLEELRIGSSPLLNEVPSGIQHIRNLKVLANYDMPREFVLSMQPDGGSEYSKVEHVQSVLFWYRVEGRRYMLFKLGEQELFEHLQGSAINMNEFTERDTRLSFYYSDGEEDSASTWNDVSRLSVSSDRLSFFSDDIVD